VATFQQIQAHSAVRPAPRIRSKTLHRGRAWPGAARLGFIIGASAVGWLLIGVGASRIL